MAVNEDTTDFVTACCSWLSRGDPERELQLREYHGWEVLAPHAVQTLHPWLLPRWLIVHLEARDVAFDGHHTSVHDLIAGIGQLIVHVARYDEFKANFLYGIIFSALDKMSKRKPEQSPFHHPLGTFGFGDNGGVFSF